MKNTDATQARWATATLTNGRQVLVRIRKELSIVDFAGRTINIVNVASIS